MMAKSKKEEKKKRLRILIFLLFITVIMLATSTYAWFTANRTVSIAPIDVNVAASSGLQISTDGGDWKTLIQNSDIHNPTDYSTHKNMLPNVLVPVSTTGARSGGYLTFFKGTVEGASNLSGALGLTANATPTEARYVKISENNYTAGDRPYFIAFDIFLKVDNDNGEDIFLDAGSGVIAQQGGSNKYLQYAARYAFVQESTAYPDGTALGTMQASNTGSHVTIIEPNYDAHTATGVTAAYNYYNQTTSADSNTNLSDGSSTVTALNYLGVASTIATPIILRDTNPGGSPGANFAAINSIANTDLVLTNTAYTLANDGATFKSYTNGVADTAISGTAAVGNKDGRDLHFLFHLDKGITKFRVYMWVEGQDVDCENNASGADLTYKLGLTLAQQ